MSNFVREHILTPHFAKSFAGWTLFGVGLLGAAYNGEQAGEHLINMQDAKEDMAAHRAEGDRQSDLGNYGDAYDESVSELDSRALASSEYLAAVNRVAIVLGNAGVAGAGLAVVSIEGRRQRTTADMPPAPQLHQGI